MEAADQRRATNWLALVISISSVVGIVLALLGYGVALAVQTRFGLPHPLTFSSTLELFNLGCWAVLQIISNSLDALIVWSVLKELWVVTWPLSLVVIVFVLVSAFILWLSIVLVRKLRPRLSKFFGNTVSGGDIEGFATTHPRTFNAVVAMAASLFVVVGTPLLMAFGLIALVVLCAVLALIPSVGLTVGKTYLDDWVIRPTVCMSVLNREGLIAKKSAKPPPAGRPKIYGANCIAIVRGKDEIDRGRVIFATPNAVVLFDPRTGDVRRVPVDGATVKVVGEL